MRRGAGRGFLRLADQVRVPVTRNFCQITGAPSQSGTRDQVVLVILLQIDLVPVDLAAELVARGRS